MKIKYEANFNGYFPVLRAIQLLLKSKKLNFSLLGAYICFISQADFDPKHANYTVITRDDYELSKKWGRSPSTVNRKRRELIDKGLLYEKDGLTRVKNFSMFELSWVKIYAKYPPSILESLFSLLLEEVAKIIEDIAETPNNQPQNSTQSFMVPSKGGLSLSDEEMERQLKDILDLVDENG